jgi:hypothetical protein
MSLGEIPEEAQPAVKPQNDQTPLIFPAETATHFFKPRNPRALLIQVGRIQSPTVLDPEAQTRRQPSTRANRRSLSRASRSNDSPKSLAEGLAEVRVAQRVSL